MYIHKLNHLSCLYSPLALVNTMTPTRPVIKREYCMAGFNIDGSLRRLGF